VFFAKNYLLENELIVNFVGNKMIEVMDALTLRKQVHRQIDRIDEKSLEAVNHMLQDYIEKGKSFELTEKHKNLIDERLENYEKSPQNVISWEESNRLLKEYL
jgi:hypothetical protein